MNKKLYVGNLLFEMDDIELQKQFETIGPVVSAKIIRFRDGGRSKGFGFVEMEKEEDVKRAIEALNDQDLKGRKTIVSEARPIKDDTAPAL